MTQTWKKMTRNLVLGTNLAPLTQIWFSKVFFPEFYIFYMSEIVTNYNWMLFEENLMNQTWEDGNKPSFELDFEPFVQNVGLKKLFCEFYLY